MLVSQLTAALKHLGKVQARRLILSWGGSFPQKVDHLYIYIYIYIYIIDSEFCYNILAM